MNGLVPTAYKAFLLRLSRQSASYTPFAFTQAGFSQAGFSHSDDDAVQYLARGYFGTQTGAVRNHTTDLPIGRPAPAPVPQPPESSVCHIQKDVVVVSRFNLKATQTKS